MLNIQNDRLNYGKLLSAPESFELTKAIGTTYTLDLFALLAIPVSLFYAKDMEGDFHLDRYDVLDAIRKSKDKIDIFCQRGKIIVPKVYKPLLAFMEDCVEEVQPLQLNASFHPKIWILRFENKGKIIYRLIVLSRNLTFDRSWDIAFFSDGIPSMNEVPASNKISEFVKKLYEQSGREIDASIIEELSRVEFDLPANFLGFESFPILPKSNDMFHNPVESFTYKELLVISPFVNKEAITTIKRNNKRITLLSRQEELDKLAPELLEGIEVYCMNDLVSNGESYLDTEGLEAKSQNLHAKIFIGESNGIADWYIGSANCTSPAFGRNTEMLVKISATKYNYRLAKIKKELFEEQSKFFVRYNRSEKLVDEEKENMDKQIRTLAYELCCLPFFGTISTGEENENNVLSIDVDLLKVQSSSIEVRVSIPHRSELKKDLIFEKKNRIEFTNIAITNLSRYLVLSFYYKGEYQKVIMVKLKLDISSEREDLIFKTLINSRDKFYQYLQFLLSPEEMKNKLQINPKNKGYGSSQLQNLFGANNPIYESLMLAASRSPNKLKEIDKVIEKLKQMDSEIVEDFLPIWTVFKEFAHD